MIRILGLDGGRLSIGHGDDVLSRLGVSTQHTSMCWSSKSNDRPGKFHFTGPFFVVTCETGVVPPRGLCMDNNEKIIRLS
uniref:Uncharacterized protein n=1 Tax=Arundo donax TaxID=35708 RepID=A0A0A8XWF2_ARUDO